MTTTPDYAGLIERLRKEAARHASYDDTSREGALLAEAASALRTLLSRAEAAEARLAAERAAHAETKARLAEARKALDDVRTAIIEADPKVLTCTLWMPARISPNETVADFLEATARRVREGGKVE